MKFTCIECKNEFDYEGRNIPLRCAGCHKKNKNMVKANWRKQNPELTRQYNKDRAYVRSVVRQDERQKEFDVAMCNDCGGSIKGTRELEIGGPVPKLCGNCVDLEKYRKTKRYKRDRRNLSKRQDCPSCEDTIDLRD